MEQNTSQRVRVRKRDGAGQRFIDRTGQRYGRLVAVERAENRRGPNGKTRVYWLCRCDCGNETTVWSWSLTRLTRSCGCIVTDPKMSEGRAARNVVSRNYQRNARLRGYCWELTEGDFDRLTSQPCFYCGLPPSSVHKVRENCKFTYSGIDRKENNVGYTLANTVSCCKTCNLAKAGKPYDEWTAWLARLTEHQFFNPRALPSRLLRDAGAVRAG